MRRTMKIRVPQRDPNERLDAKSMWHLPNVLADPEEKAVCRELLAQCHCVGMRRVGDVTAFLGELDRGERKTLLDGLRRVAGLKPEEPKVTRTGGGWSPWQMCPACGAVPLDEQTHTPIPVSVKRWWCEAHRDEAAPGDMSVLSSGIRMSESGALVPIDEGETERDRVRAELRRRRHEEKLAQRRFEAEQGRREKEAADAAFRRELPPGFGG
jgi:hypothetical protein